MTSTPSIEPAPDLKSRGGASAYLAALRVPIIILCLFGAGLAAYFFVYVTHQTEYLVGRDFRLLATIGNQVEETIANDQRILVNLFLPDKHVVDAEIRDHRMRQVDFIPILRSARIVAWPEPAVLAQSDRRPSDRGSDSLVLQFVERNSLELWAARGEPPVSTGVAAVVRLGLDDLLGPLLQRETQRGIFEVLLVAALDGRVIFQTEDQKPRITRLDTLTNRAESKGSPAVKFEDLVRAPAIVDVVVSGSRYKLFTWPCCGSMAHGASQGGTPAAGNSDGWVLGGLVAERALSGESYKASFSIVTIVLVILLLALFCWPFLKLSLIGETQRVKAHDVALVGLGTLLGTALLAVCVLDLYAYRRLEVVLDDQLQSFAETISLRAHGEIASAYEELTRLEHVFGHTAALSEDTVENLVQHHLFRPQDYKDYPFFESFSVLNDRGVQRRKLTFGSFVTPLITVKDREYFTYWGSPHAPQVRAFLQPIHSATTGAREAVLSSPMPPQKPDQKAEVGTLSIPMYALIDPVIPPGFGFAVINPDGKVLFHSHPQHELSENFFVESDGSRRLRALVAAKRTGWADIKYWGDDHRAFVVPMDPRIERRNGDPIRIAPTDQWTIVTFYDRELIRTVNVEWLALVVMFLAIYAAGYVAISVGLLVLRPKYRAPWLWPDPARSKAYLDLFSPLLLLSVAFVVAIAVLPHADLLLATFLLPFLALTATYITLTERRGWPGLAWPILIEFALLVPLLILVGSGDRWMWRGALVGLIGGGAAWPVVFARRHGSDRPSPLAPPVSLSYGLAAGLLLALTTVLPAAGFFRIGHGVQIGNFIKYGELHAELQRIERDKAEGAIARQFSTTDDRLRALKAQSPDWGIYDTFFAPTPRQRIEAAPCVTDRPSALAETLEEFLPFYSESSVLMRELVHDQAADRSWAWRRCGAVLEFHRPADSPRPVMWAVPAFFESSADRASLLYLAIGSVLIVGVLAWLVRFMLHKIFLISVIEPLWSGNPEPPKDLWGPHLFLVTGAPMSGDLRVRGYCEIDVSLAPGSESQESQWFNEQLDRIKHAPAGQNVLILHFEHGIMDKAFNERKLALLEGIVDVLNRTIVVVSAAPTSLFASSNAARWSRVLSRFTIVPVTPTPDPAAAPAASSSALFGDLRHASWREILWRINALGFAHSAKFLDDECRNPTIGRLWKDVLPFAWHPDRPPLDLEQLLIEVGERAENYYQEIWATCTPAEKMVLGQIAEEGLVNPKTTRTVRMLMARGLVRRQPHFLLMNESFRQFVLSSVPRREVQSLENQSTGAWDSVRWPFMILVGTGLAFFFATQHELFDTTLGVITGLGAAVPALVKIASVFGNRQANG